MPLKSGIWKVHDHDVRPVEVEHGLADRG